MSYFSHILHLLTILSLWWNNWKTQNLPKKENVEYKIENQILKIKTYPSFDPTPPMLPACALLQRARRNPRRAWVSPPTSELRRSHDCFPLPNCSSRFCSTSPVSFNLTTASSAVADVSTCLRRRYKQLRHELIGKTNDTFEYFSRVNWIFKKLFIES